MKWIGQHIWDFISRFRSTVYLENLDTSSEQNALVVDSDGKVTKNTSLGGDDLTITNAGDNKLVTSSGGTVLNGEDTLFYQDAILIISSGDSSKPGFYIVNSNTDDSAMILEFNKTADGADGDNIAKIEFQGDNNLGGSQKFAQITGKIQTALATDEAGKLLLEVAASDGGSPSGSALQQALTATGHGTNNTVDVGLGYGAASTTTIAGDLHVGGEAITSDGYSGQSMSAGTLSWNGTSCKVFPNEFMVNDGGGTWRIDETGGGVYSGRFSDTSTEAVCYFRIPNGKKVTSIRFNTATTASNICSVRPINYVTGAAGTEQDFDSNSVITSGGGGSLTEITGALTTDLLLTYKPASTTNGLLGVLVTISDV